jgi:hypothetical protein
LQEAGADFPRLIDPAPDQSPSVLVPELACWLRGSKISNLFGARPTLAPRCDCQRCGGRRLTGFLRREHQDHAIAHAVAVWSRWTADLLDQDTMRGRAEYWRALCHDAVGAHAVISQQLGLDESDYLEPQAPLTVQRHYRGHHGPGHPSVPKRTTPVGAAASRRRTGPSRQETGTAMPAGKSMSVSSRSHAITEPRPQASRRCHSPWSGR